MKKRIFTKHNKAIDVGGLRLISPISHQIIGYIGVNFFNLTYTGSATHQVAGFSSKEEAEECRTSLIKFWEEYVK